MEGNLLKAEVLPEDVSNAFISLALMRRTTGVILTVDGGNVAAMVRGFEKIYLFKIFNFSIFKNRYKQKVKK